MSSSPEISRSTSTSAPLALRVLLATADPTWRERLRAGLDAAMPAVLHVIDDLADCAVSLHEQQFDIVVADAATPGFTDPMLLRMARDTQPSALRVALVSESPTADGVSLSMVAHIVAEPDDHADLPDRIRRAATRQRMIDSPAVRAQVAQCDVLPAAPMLYTQLATVLSMDDVPMHAVAEVVSQDPEVAARILQLANSAATGRRSQTSDLSSAVAYVGVSTVRGLVLTLEVLRAFRRHESRTVTRLAEELALHGQTVAEMALLVDGRNREGYTAGLLHDIGKLILAANDHVGWERVEMRVAGGATHVEAEEAVFGTTHDAVGAALLASWGLPAELVDAVAFHHTPDELGTELHLAGVIHVADALSYDDSSQRRLDRAWVQRAGLSSELAAWREESQGSLV